MHLHKTRRFVLRRSAACRKSRLARLRCCCRHTPAAGADGAAADEVTAADGCDADDVDDGLDAAGVLVRAHVMRSGRDDDVLENAADGASPLAEPLPGETLAQHDDSAHGSAHGSEDAPVPHPVPV